ncbi:phosphoglycerate mutase-like protein [Aaosphaeria arxii CBS 175.79]|uniref:Phosphoglycerate mutase-like protein n=1 Tax=Aaosphaeria arxii CBS 175.79 TaxID=1450172 RepID=A0A6A5Y3N4_9PLEO|nr:phosphoglycerate mutase-like protein [Aaosphaeria arxii CBS 175.79]KAF2020088.1 phosphoglycerate mutase-like protein [Aaosphaeria arxii CBS 175.79]
MIETIYYVRHAYRSGFNVDHETGTYTPNSFIKHPTGIGSDPPLTSHGVDQSHELAKYLLEEIQPPIDAVYSSPMYRCLQTLKPTTDKLFQEPNGRLKGGKIRIEHGVGEFYGRAGWTHPSPPSIQELNKHFANIDQDYVTAVKINPNGEFINELHERVKKALHKIVSALDADPAGPKTLLICSHAGTMIAAGRALTGVMPDDPDTEDFYCYTAGVSRFERKSKESKEVIGQWDCVLNSETKFLKDGAERGWKFNGEESFVAFPESESSNSNNADKPSSPKL